jgi:formate hydrogenlyase transcriptional activator
MSEFVKRLGYDLRILTNPVLADGSVFRVAAETASSGIVVCDETGTILFVTPCIEEAFGYSALELMGRSIEGLFPIPGRTGPESFWAFCQRSKSNGIDIRHDVPGRPKDGTVTRLEVVLAAAEHEGHRFVIASVVDIARRRALQAGLEHTPDDSSTFERLVTDLAGRLVVVHPEDVESAIVEGIEKIALSLGLDRGSWWELHPGTDDAVVRLTWTLPEYRVMQSGESARLQVPWMLSRIRKGEVLTIGNPDDIPSATDREGLKRFGVKSTISIPFRLNGEVTATLGFSSIRDHYVWSSEVVDRLRLVTAVFGQALVRKANEERLQRMTTELTELRDHIAKEGVHLRREARTIPNPRLIVADSPATKRVLEQIESVAPTNATVLLCGETGTGKELFAQTIHRGSEWHRRPMVTVNCAAIPTALIESELFGREKGAYTGAIARHIGRFEMANDSTIFLDEVGELPLDAQVKLLRVLQERVIERLGGGQPVKVNVRIIAATNRDLEKAVADHAFREDLFYRLNVFPITIPPLRDRADDIPALVWSFIEEYSNAFRKPIESISKDSLAALQHYHWPGNVRELRNVIERAVIISKGPRLIVDVPAGPSRAARKSTRLADIEAEQIRQVLEGVGWRVRGPGGAAEQLGIKPNTLDSRMAKLGIKRPAD